jgi:hypothetical protein
VEYDDGLIAIDDDGLVIRKYDALLRPKRIRYEEIKAAEEFPLGRVRGRWRIWGSGDLNLRHWFNLDWHRPHKDVGLVLDLGKRMQPVITPDDPSRAVAALREHGVVVTER